MAQVLVRDLDDSVVDKLKARAKRHGRSLEAELRLVLERAAGADMLIIEMHPHPDRALCDGAQSLDRAGFRDMMEGLKPIAEAVGREV